ncbi:uncharacterized protein LOC130053211 [Ostrea edulis]|uniref:uncharacterized protein LOC130053211 n=1 Tax=Ostrea edulis TaxID=37623 RepID=UPI0024AF575C|nr:uncharacterized protein LOC130053211 [Ostrea edulis]
MYGYEECEIHDLDRLMRLKGAGSGSHVVKSDILFHLASMNLNITKFVPVKYRTSQVGTKTNYLVKIEIFPGYYIHVKIHRYSFGTPSFDDLRAGKSLSDILEPF